MDNEQIAVEIAKLSTVMTEVRDDVKEIKDEGKARDQRVASLEHSRSRLRGILLAIGGLGGAGAGEAAGVWSKIFGS